MLRVSALFLTFAVIACSGGPPRSVPGAPAPVATPAPAPADVLVDRMLHALEAEDVVAWRELLSAPMRTRLAGDEAALHDHLMGWRRDVLPLAQTLRHADLAVDDAEHVVTYAADGNEPIALASVVVEGGALYLDEN